MFIKNVNAPCKGCTERYPACHSKCEKYKAFKEELGDVRNKIIKAKVHDKLLCWDENKRKNVTTKHFYNR